MLLVIDIGNTDIVFAAFHQDTWSQQWRIPSDRKASSAHFSSGLLAQMKMTAILPENIQTVILSNVVPLLTPTLIDVSVDTLGITPIIMGPEIYPFLDIEVLNPDEIGTDLVANSVAAYHRYPRTCIVVDFGTALTFTTINDAGTITGVSIAPGLKTAMHALFHKAAQLPEVPLSIPESVLGKNTTHALQAGILWGYVGLVEGVLDKIQEELDQKCRIIATGGLSGVLTPLKRRFDEIDRMLTLDGLRIISEQVKTRKKSE